MPIDKQMNPYMLHKSMCGVVVFFCLFVLLCYIFKKIA
jgi:hypothetical protein